MLHLKSQMELINYTYRHRTESKSIVSHSGDNRLLLQQFMQAAVDSWRELLATRRKSFFYLDPLLLL